VSARVGAYDPRSGTWTRAPDLPLALSGVALGVLGDDLWAVGGFATEGDQNIAQAATYRFRPGDSAWKAGPLLKTPRAGVALATLNDTLIAIGGATTDGGTLDTVETLGLGDTDWKAGAPLTQKRADASAVVGGGRVYAIGGLTDGAATALDKVESWRPGDTWRAEESLKTKRARAGASGLCVAGGENSAGPVASVECLAARKWTTKFQSATPRYGLAVVALDGWLHLIGGTPASGSTVSPAHEIFDLGG
jgi:non-specific serine/threonine protein kinase